MMLRSVQKKRDSVCQYPRGKRKLRPGLCRRAEDTKSLNAILSPSPPLAAGAGTIWPESAGKSGCKFGPDVRDRPESFHLIYGAWE
jgi:hypothetical protein